MFCYQCQETKSNIGCDVKGVCGKSDEVASLQDLLMYITKGISFCVRKTISKNLDNSVADKFVIDALFTTITNVNFNSEVLKDKIMQGVTVRDNIKRMASGIALGADLACGCNLPDAGSYTPESRSELLDKSKTVSILTEKNEDIRSAKELLIYGLKGVTAYAHHASALGFEDSKFYEFMHIALAYTLDEKPDLSKLVELVLECGNQSVNIMALLDKANTEVFGKQTISEVNRNLTSGKAILISGHDMLDLYELLKQTEDKGIDIYTHGEMLTAHAYPKLKAFKHLKGHYGTAWHNQVKEFVNFNGTFLFTTNCIQKPLDSYKDRVYTTGVTSFEGLHHIEDRTAGKMKDFSSIINATLKTENIQSLKKNPLTVGFAKDSVMSIADKIVDAVKNGSITKFVVMAGCDGRDKKRDYFTELAKSLPDTTIILTAGCAKYRYNDLDLGSICGIPRILDAGQCNDSYSLAYIALQLKAVFNLDDINKLPLEFAVGWYEQKAVAVLLALLALGFKGVRIGTTLPAFLSPNVAKLLIDTFDLKITTTVEEDLKEIA